MQIGKNLKNVMMSKKMEKFSQLFKQTSLIQFLSVGGGFDDLLKLLAEDEIDRLIATNVIFIQSCAPASNISLKDINVNGNLTLINIDHNYFTKLQPKEVIGILLHEIGHAFNPKLKNMEGEYAADEYAAQKGYAKWIIRGLESGMKNHWLGFEKDRCDLRIKKLQIYIDQGVS